MSPSPKFWDKIAEKYSKQPIADQASYEHKLAITREYLTPTSNVAEFGCGTGGTAIAHAPYVKHILATDLSPNMIAIAKQKAQEQNIENVTFEVGSIEEMPVMDECYDSVLTMSLLHLLDDKEDAMMKIRQMLKPNGVFVSSTACIADKMWFFKIIAPIAKFFGVFPTVKVFGQQHLVEQIKAAGFEIEHEWRPEKGIAVFIVARKPA